MDIYAQIAEKIIKEQQSIIGPIAVEQAGKVPGLKVSLKNDQVVIDGNKKDVLENLVKQYEKLFGLTSVEVCRDAVKGIISQAPQDQIPKMLL
jgi:hypothetical protein